MDYFEKVTKETAAECIMTLGEMKAQVLLWTDTHLRSSKDKPLVITEVQPPAVDRRHKRLELSIKTQIDKTIVLQEPYTQNSHLGVTFYFAGGIWIEDGPAAPVCTLQDISDFLDQHFITNERLQERRSEVMQAISYKKRPRDDINSLDETREKRLLKQQSYYKTEAVRTLADTLKTMDLYIVQDESQLQPYVEEVSKAKLFRGPIINPELTVADVLSKEEIYRRVKRYILEY